MKKIIVRAPILSASGYGQQARFAIRSLRRFPNEFDIYLLNTIWGGSSWLWKDDEERRWIDQLLIKTHLAVQNNAQFDLSLQITIPGEFQNLAPVNVGYTAGTESTKISKQWHQIVNQIDRLITTSNHAKFAFDNTNYPDLNPQKCVKPIIPVSYPVRKFEPKNVDLDLPFDFNFLLVGQWCPRRNLEETIKGFVEEFAGQEVGLVVKTSTMNNCIRDRRFTENRLKNLLKDFSDRTCKVYLLHGDLCDEEMAGLYSHPKIKCLINLSFGEGFGLPIFEAATYGLPVIAPNWGGQTDYISKEKEVKIKGKKVKKNVCLISPVEYDIQPVQKEAYFENVIIPQSQWCFPKKWRYRVRMREMIKDYKTHKKNALELQEHVLSTFTEQKQTKLFAEAVLGHSITDLREVSISDLPKISIITSVFNGDQFIRGFLEDVEKQTIFKEKCELVLVNANSPGNEKEVIREFQAKHPNNVKVIDLDEDPGLYACWNIGIENASGDFVSNWNLDDRRSPSSIERYAKELMLNPDLSFVYADSLISNIANEDWEMITKRNDAKRYTFETFSKEAFLRGNQSHQTLFFRRSVVDLIGKFDESFRSAADWEFCLRAFVQHDLKAKKIDEVLNVYYWNPEGVSTNPANNSWKIKEEMGIFGKYQKVYLEKKNEMSNK